MELSSILTVSLILLLIASGIAYSILTYVRPQEVQSLTPSTGSLQEEREVGTSKQVRDSFFVPSGATFSTYLYTTIPRNPDDGTFLFRFGQVLGVFLRNGGVSTEPRVVLYVLTSQPQPKYELFDLPMLPSSKWVHFALVREGRRYTVYYNGKVVASERTQFVPVFTQPSLILGSPKTLGRFVYPKLTPVAYRLEDVKREMEETSDSRHAPSIPTDWSSLNLFKGCPDGLFCFSTSSPPKANPLKYWSTPYA